MPMVQIASQFMDLSGTRGGRDLLKNAHLHGPYGPYVDSLGNFLVGGPYGGGMPTSRELVLRAYCPIVRFVDHLRLLRRSITVSVRSN